MNAASPDSLLRDCSVESQRARLLKRLQEGPINTFAARRELNVAHPAGRVQELREDGYNILTFRRPVFDDHGHKHSLVATYYLSSAANEGCAHASNSV